MGFLALCFIVFVVLRFVWPARKRASNVWGGVVVALYLVLSLPAVAVPIAGNLPPVTTADPRSLKAVGSIVVLDGDNRVGRVQAVTQIHRANPTAPIAVLGQRWILGALVSGGVPSQLIARDDSSPTTSAQIEWVRRRLDDGLRRPVILVASRLQMPRVSALTRDLLGQIILVSSPVDREPPVAGAWRFVPMYIALRVSRDALYEHAALAYYRRRGWITP